ncbi:MAG: glycosyltransferase, partial [Planctomycetota bacterium]
MMFHPFFSVIIPVWKEEENILPLLDHLRHVLDKDHEILVVDGDVQGSTIRMIPKGWAKTMIAPKGRACQMNEGAKKAQGDILIFLHCDTLLPQKPLQKISEAFQQKKIKVGAFNLAFNSHKWIFQLLAKVASYRSRLFRIPYGDQAIFFQREFFFQIGGFPEIPLFEDMAIMQEVKRRKEPIFFI